MPELLWNIRYQAPHQFADSSMLTLGGCPVETFVERKKNLSYSDCIPHHGNYIQATCSNDNMGRAAYSCAMKNKEKERKTDRKNNFSCI